MDRKKYRNAWLALCAAALLAFCAACGETGGQPAGSLPNDPPPSQAEGEENAAEPPAAAEDPERFEGNYVLKVADELLAEILSPGMTQTEQAAAIYEHLITYTAIDQPAGLDIWRIRGGDDGKPIPYLENRALSPLVFGIGSCEDYAAALTLLLQRAGMQAEYVPGITVSARGGFVDHAWTIAEIDGSRYHLDSHLEDTIIKDNMLTWRYFMRSDDVMLASHRWGKNLIDYGGLREEQIVELRRFYLTEACPQNFPAPEPKELPQPTAPDRAALVAELEREKEIYELAHGALPPITLDLLPPVFAGGTYP